MRPSTLGQDFALGSQVVAARESDDQERMVLRQLPAAPAVLVLTVIGVTVPASSRRRSACVAAGAGGHAGRAGVERGGRTRRSWIRASAGRVRIAMEKAPLGIRSAQGPV